MPSKYDDAWGNIFDEHGGLGSLLDRVRSGETVSIQVDELLKYGSRSNWYGRVVLSGDGIVSSQSAAHVNALKNVLCKHIPSEEKIECSVMSKDDTLVLHMRLYAARPPRGKPKVIQPSLPQEPVLGPKELGDFYILVSSFEQELRSFIGKLMGQGYIKRLKNDLPNVVDGWKERAGTDRRWGIEPEPELINYALLTDYMQIVRRYRRIFASSKEELNDVLTHLKIFANQGRNPLMHCRTLTLQKNYATKAAVSFLREWIKRRTGFPN